MERINAMVHKNNVVQCEMISCILCDGVSFFSRVTLSLSSFKSGHVALLPLTISIPVDNQRRRTRLNFTN